MKKYSMDEINKIRERMTSGDMYQTTDWPEIPRAFDQLLTENERYRAALSGIVKRSEDTGHYDINSAEASKALKGEE